jgi:hypothetical protein
MLNEYITNFMEQSPSWEANSRSASQKVPAFYGARMLINVFTIVRHVSLSWAKINRIHTI